MSKSYTPDPRAPIQDTKWIRPYRRYLTSILHKRFVLASGLALLFCWAAAICLGSELSYFWRCFPFGMAGVRLILLYFSSLAVFILQVASLQIGRRSTSSPFETIWRTFIGFKFFQIMLWYILSAWWFGEVYIWSAHPSSALGWVVIGGSSTSDALNERPIHLRSFFFMLALFKTVVHLSSDHSSVHIPVSALSSPAGLDIRTHRFPPIWQTVQKPFRRVLTRSVAISIVVAAIGPIIYNISLRPIMWRWHLSFAKLIYDIPRSDGRPTGPVPNDPSMSARFWAGLLLMLIWEISLASFNVFLAQEPLIKDKPLSTTSKDPNGTLITGLAAKRNLVKTFAFWELVAIAQSHPDRRKAIFADIDRPDGPAWAQMLKEASAVIDGVCSRVRAATPEKNLVVAKPPGIKDLPKITAPIKKKPNIYAANPPPGTKTEAVEALLSRGAKRVGQSPRPYEPDVSGAVGLLTSMAGDVNQTIRPNLNSTWSTLKNSPVGWFFSTNFSRRVNSVILGSPNANAALIVDAIEATTRMLTASLSEDTFGTVMFGVPDTVRLFTSTIVAIEAFIQSIEQAPSPNVDVEEVEIIYARLKAGLTQLLSAFQLFLTDQGVSAAEHRAAANASRPGRLVAGSSDAVSAKVGDSGEEWMWLWTLVVKGLSGLTDVSTKLLKSWDRAHESRQQVKVGNREERRPEMEKVGPSSS